MPQLSGKTASDTSISNTFIGREKISTFAATFTVYIYITRFK